MREPFVAGAAAGGQQPLFLVALEAPVPRSPLRGPAHQSAGIGVLWMSRAERVVASADRSHGA